MFKRNFSKIFLLCITSILLSGCGVKGPLYFPSQNTVATNSHSPATPHNNMAVTKNTN
ncbi:MAG: lipoprotein [Psittacicella sp.]